jgi:hypothetical protein
MSIAGVLIFMSAVWAVGLGFTLSMSRGLYGNDPIPSDEKYRRRAARLWVFAPFWPVLAARWFVRTTIWAFKNSRSIK